MNNPQTIDVNIHNLGESDYSIIGDGSYYLSPQLDCIWHKPCITPNASQMRVRNLAGRYDFEHVREGERERARQIVELAALANAQPPCTFRNEAQQWHVLLEGGEL